MAIPREASGAVAQRFTKILEHSLAHSASLKAGGNSTAIGRLSKPTHTKAVQNAGTGLMIARIKKDFVMNTGNAMQVMLIVFIQSNAISSCDVQGITDDKLCALWGNQGILFPESLIELEPYLTLYSLL